MRCLGIILTNAWFAHCCCYCTVAQSCPTLRSHALQHTRFPCRSLSPRVCSNSCPLSQWRHPIISCSVAPFSSCLRSFPASGSFPMSQFHASGGQSIGVCSNSCLLSQWCYLTISSSAALFFCLQSFPASWFFSSESVLHIRWPKYWSFSISPSNEYSGMISLRLTGWLLLLSGS